MDEATFTGTVAFPKLSRTGSTNPDSSRPFRDGKTEKDKTGQTERSRARRVMIRMRCLPTGICAPPTAVTSIFPMAIIDNRIPSLHPTPHPAACVGGSHDERAAPFSLWERQSSSPNVRKIRVVGSKTRHEIRFHFSSIWPTVLARAISGDRPLGRGRDSHLLRKPIGCIAEGRHGFRFMQTRDGSSR
jgi:hypothetical protein